MASLTAKKLSASVSLSNTLINPINISHEAKGKEALMQTMSQWFDKAMIKQVTNSIAF